MAVGNDTGFLKNFGTQKLATIIVISALGAISSIAVGYAGKVLSLTPLGPAAGQLLAGLHVFWLVLVATVVKNRGAATVSGALIGAIGMVLPNHLGLLVFFMALLEGVVVDLALLPFNRITQSAALFAAGLSSASNVLVLQVFQVFPVSVPLGVFAAMYGASFLSGLVLGGYLSVRSLKVLKQFSYRP